MSQHGQKRFGMQCKEGELNIKYKEYWIVRDLIGTRTFHYLLRLEGKTSDNRLAKESKVT